MHTNRPAPARRPLAVHAIAAWRFTILLLTPLLTLAQPAHADNLTEARQSISIGQEQPYQFAVYANQSLQSGPNPSRTAVVLVHGVKRNADEYFAIGKKLLTAADMPPDTLLLAPNFMTSKDDGSSTKMPLWGGGTWMHGALSEQGVTGLSTFTALDDIVQYLADRTRFPQLREIVLIGHSAGAQLMQRYAVMNQLDAPMRSAGIHVRYVISSPSSYLYLDPLRPTDDSFALPKGDQCPGYDNYRYGIGDAPDYLKRQSLDGQQLFTRYAARDITYMVGARDNDPNHRYLDRACGAALQGGNRAERQRNFMRYEQLLATRWNVAVQHPEFEVEGAGHNAARLYQSPATARRMLGR